jgi:diguanylate cyclase (GGDEF)-like protein/PAS domain S-box-containing protein
MAGIDDFGQSERDSILQQALENCEKEAIHQVGSVQPHGVLLALDGDFVIRYCSDNAEMVFSESRRELLGQAFANYVSALTVESISALEGLGDWRSSAVIKVDIETAGRITRHDAAVSFNAPYWLVEVETTVADQSELFSQMFVPTRDLLWQLDSEHDLQEYTAKVAELVRLATGYDRVMMYQFDSNWDGEVIAESRSELTRSYLGHRFPASDIPSQARALYTRNLTRVIADVKAPPVRVRGEDSGTAAGKLDLTYSAYRSLSPVHLEYLGNMGVSATLTISLLQNGRLWGMLACHHKSPKYVTLRERELYELIGKTISIKLSDLKHHEEKKLKDRVNRLLFNTTITSLEGLSANHAGELMAIVGATGLVVLDKGNRYRFGETPSQEQIERLESELRQWQPTRVFHTQDLPSLFPEAKDYADKACGIMLAPLNHKLDHYLLWCRGCMTYTEQWAGQPHKEISRTEEGFRISPRSSFDSWTQIYDNRSTPWTALEIELAGDLADAFIQQVNQKSLLAQGEQLRNLVEFSTTMIMRLDAQGCIRYTSAASERILGRAPASLEGIEFVTLLDKDDGGHFRQLLASLPSTGAVDRLVVNLVHEDGRCVWGEVECTPAADGDTPAVIVTVNDITQRHNYQMALEDLHRRHALTRDTALDQTSEAVVITGPDNRIISVNRAFCEISGYNEAEAIGQNPSFLQSGIHTLGFYQELWRCLKTRGCWEGEIWNRRKTGEVFPFLGRISAVHEDNGSVRNFVGVFSDNSQAREAEESLRFARHYDSLTGLPNRQFCLEQIHQSIQAARENGGGLAVVLLDIDSFKLLNDSQGHDSGDRFLKSMANRLVEKQPDNGTLFRWGSDEFLLLLESVEDKESIALVLQGLLVNLSKPFLLPNHEVIPSACAGISFYPEDATDTKELIKAADTALFRAKECGPANIELFAPALAERVHRRFEIESELRRAIRNSELQLYYQPQVNSQTGALIGVEALVRWNHPRKGLVPPSEFISLAEESGLIELLGDWVLTSALEQMAQWREFGQGIPRVAVNIAPQQFVPEFVNRVKELLCRYQVPADALELEITEGILDRNEQVLTLLNQIREIGVHLSIDDFGTGYSSLAHLKHLPVSCFKLDKAFVDGLPEGTFDVAILRAVLALGQSLNIKVLAEGVETEAQFRFLAEQRVDSIQGYFFGKPMSAEGLSLWLEERRQN